MTTIAAVDVGSNGMRLAIGRLLDEQIPHIVKTHREAIRLGKDVFSSGNITEETIDQSLQAFGNFRKHLDEYEVQHIRAIGTSALREAENQDLFIDRIYQNSGIEIETVSAEEEARLVHLAVTQSYDMRDKRAMLIDIGGGSVEIVLSQNGNIESTDSLKIGTVRLLELLRNQGSSDEIFGKLTKDYVHRTEKWFGNVVAGQTFQMCIGVGGNVEALGKLRKEKLHKETNGEIHQAELSQILEMLEAMSYEDRIDKFRLRPDRADVIIPASIVLTSLMRQGKIERLLIPKVGVKDGILLDIADTINLKGTRIQRDAVIYSALQVGRRYRFDEDHGRSVAKLALDIFDQTQDLHNLDQESRLLLEVAALLHDVGRYIRNSGHHKHTYYLLRETPIVGLDSAQMARAANIARYHRKAKPTPRHEPYEALPRYNRIEVSKLAAILRIAAALDLEQNGRVTEVRFQHNDSNVELKIIGKGSLLLEKWAVLKRCSLFEEVFGVNFSIADNEEKD